MATRNHPLFHPVSNDAYQNWELQGMLLDGKFMYNGSRVGQSPFFLGERFWKTAYLLI